MTLLAASGLVAGYGKGDEILKGVSLTVGSGEIVAIKVLRRKWSNDAHKIELFEREGKVGMSLSHPNIVQILNVSQDSVTSQYYIVMEFVEGGNLRDIL